MSEPGASSVSFTLSINHYHSVATHYKTLYIHRRHSHSDNTRKTWTNPPQLVELCAPLPLGIRVLDATKSIGFYFIAGLTLGRNTNRISELTSRASNKCIILLTFFIFKYRANTIIFYKPIFYEYLYLPSQSDSSFDPNAFPGVPNRNKPDPTLGSKLGESAIAGDPILVLLKIRK
jgi:hypothetical protein